MKTLQGILLVLMLSCFLAGAYGLTFTYAGWVSPVILTGAGFLLVWIFVHAYNRRKDGRP